MQKVKTFTSFLIMNWIWWKNFSFVIYSGCLLRSHGLIVHRTIEIYFNFNIRQSNYYEFLFSTFEMKNLLYISCQWTLVFVCFLWYSETFIPNMVDRVDFLVLESLCIPSKLHFMVRHNMHLIKGFCSIEGYIISIKSCQMSQFTNLYNK